MKQQVTFEALLLIERDIETQMTNSPAFGFFNHSKISTFYKENSHALAKGKKKVKELMEAHVKADGEGNWQRIVEDDKFIKLDFKSDIDEVLYREKYDEFFKQLVMVSC